MKKLLLLVAAPALVLVACSRPEPGAKGSRVVLQNKGSDTLVNVAQAWAEAYKEVDPNTAIAVTGGGSGTGISALINGTVDIANASREMKDQEIASAKANGVEPVEFVVGYDALAVFLHPDNPATSLSFEQLAGIYGDGGETVSWSQLGLDVPGCSSGEIVVVSRQNNSGTYAYFQEVVLGGKDFKLGTRDMHGSKDVVDLVENTPCAIGYSGLAYATEHIKKACIGEAGACVEPTVEGAISGEYPIARSLLMYTSGQPTGGTKAYMDWILSDAGQCILLDKGYAPAAKVSCK